MDQSIDDNGDDLVEIKELVKLTDVGLMRDDISWAKVKSTSSRCICCCSNSTIKLITDQESYEFLLDTDILANCDCAQVNENMQHIAISNENKIIIIDLIDDTRCEYANIVREVNLSANGLTMRDVIHWQWIDQVTLGIITQQHVYTCCITQPQINHFAHSAITNRSKSLNLNKEFDCDQKLTTLCQITSIQRDATCNIFALSGLTTYLEYQKKSNTCSTLTSNRFSFMTNDSLDNYQSDSREGSIEENICGLVQIYCCIRKRSQTIEAHAVAFSTPLNKPKSKNKILVPTNANHTTLIAANKIGESIKVYFIDMPTVANTMCQRDPTQTIKINSRWSDCDVPTSIVCARQKELNLAYITTKYGQMLVCDTTNSDILFQVTITSDIICCTVAEKNGQGIYVISRDGQVILVKVILDRLLNYIGGKYRNKHLEKTLLKALDMAGVNNHRLSSELNEFRDKKHLNKSMDARLDCALNVEDLESTKL